MPTVGIMSKRVNIMATVVRSPSMEFPGPTENKSHYC